jgi:hypothetical protein
MLEFERDPIFSNDDRHDLARPETRERTMRKVGPSGAHVSLSLHRTALPLRLISCLAHCRPCIRHSYANLDVYVGGWAGQVASLLPYLLSESEQTSRTRMDLLSLVDPGFMTRVGVHYGLFFGAIRGQATMEQMSSLLEKGLLNLRGMYGCFAMTELGYAHRPTPRTRTHRQTHTKREGERERKETMYVALVLTA